MHHRNTPELKNLAQDLPTGTRSVNRSKQRLCNFMSVCTPLAFRIPSGSPSEAGDCSEIVYLSSRSALLQALHLTEAESSTYLLRGNMAALSDHIVGLAERRNAPAMAARKLRSVASTKSSQSVRRGPTIFRHGAPICGLNARVAVKDSAPRAA